MARLDRGKALSPGRKKAMSEKMFVLKENGDGTLEEYDGKYNITIHCRSQAERERVMLIIQKAASILKEENAKSEHV